VDHDQRETVLILVYPRDDNDDDDDDDDGAGDADDSGAVSDRTERLSLTFATPMMDHRCGTTATALHSFKQHGY
jgi:hypothetical protein